MDGIDVVTYRTPACDDHLDENESMDCPWCVIDQMRAAIKECAAESAMTGEVYLARLFPFVPELSDDLELTAQRGSPGWQGMIDVLDEWLKHYPPDIFTGVSGDPGALFIVSLRNAREQLRESEDADTRGQG